MDQFIEEENIQELKDGKSEYTQLLDFNKNIIKEPLSKEEENLQLHAGAAVLLDGDNSRVLYEKKGHEKRAMASTTKIMSCIIALENGDLDDTVVVSKYASTMPDVQLNIKEGEEYRLEDLLYSLMLESHNDVAVAIAEHIGGSVEGFAKMMNTKAKELGCLNTNFVTPNGLDAEEHYTTAVEIARIASYAIKNEEFIKITNAPNWTFEELTTGRSFMVSNKDKFLYMYDGAIGVKTGFTNNAGYCFVGAVKKNGKTLISSVLASGWPPNRNFKWKDTSCIMDYGMENYEKKDIFYPQTFHPIYVEDGIEKKVDLYYDGEISLLLNKNDTIKIIFKLAEKLKAPVKKDTVVGKASYYVNDQLIKEIPIYTKDSIKQIDFDFCMNKIVSLWLIRES